MKDFSHALRENQRIKINFVFGILVLFVCCKAWSESKKTNFLSAQDLDDNPIFNSHLQTINKMGLKNTHWVCARRNVEKVKIRCDDLGIHELEGPKEELQIFVTSKKYAHEYGLRHAISRSECRRIKKSLLKMVKESKTICFRGHALSEAPLVKGKYEIGWVFDEAKTEKTTLCEFNGC